MRKIAFLAALAWAIIVPITRAAAAQPVIVELYTAQGCSACAAANGVVGKLAEKKGVLPLTFAVDYWNYLGWTDTFAKPAYAERQKAAMKRLDLRDVYTPQVIVDGRAQAAGSQKIKIDALVQAALKAPRHGPSMRFLDGGFVRINAAKAPRGGAEAWLIRYQPEPAKVEVTEGESRGKTVVYTNAVRELTRLGTWTGRRRTFATPPTEDPDLKTVVILQSQRTGAILSVLQQDDE